MRGTLILFTIAMAVLFRAKAEAVTSTSVTLAWNPSPESNVAGYDIFYGTSSGNYTSAVSVLSATNVTIRGLQSGVTYYFAAASFDTNGDLSPNSPEISATVGATGQVTGTLTTIGALSAGQFGFTLSGVTGGQYVVEASTDLVHWVALQTNTAPFQFIDSNASQFTRRFYRTVYNQN